MAIKITDIDGNSTVTFENAVLEVGHRNHRVMSDIWTTATFALVWSPEKGFHEILVDSHFELDTSRGFAEVDAPRSLFDLRTTELAKLEEDRRNRRALELKVLEDVERNRPVRGKHMKVVKKTAELPVGHEGVVAFVRDGRVLLKSANVWNDRNANGVWVNERHLKAC